MNLFSLIKSSSLEIVFSKKTLASIYLTLGLFVQWQQIAATLQFHRAYFSLHQFDASVAEFIIITAGLLLPFWLVGALMLRAALQRMRLAYWARTGFTYAMFATSFSPAEAGLLVDHEFNHKEFMATLLDMHLKGYIDVQIGDSLVQTTAKKIPNELSLYEQSLLKILYGSSTTVNYRGFHDPFLIEKAKNAHEALVQQLTNNKYLRQERLPSKNVRSLFRALYLIAGSMGVLYIAGLLIDPDNLFSINYPRYPVSSIELWLLAATSLITLVVVLSGFWPRFHQNEKQTDYSAWIQVSGFMLYLRTVYADRLSPEFINSQDLATIKAYTSYAMAFGIIPSDEATLSLIIAVSNQKTRPTSV